ncbi:MAG: hypothetical protein M1820_008538 [Bogoriella megaspora]|nr:MAG: hypothetical protein M1820_008538 [Bogoriella megaspora]
MISFLGLPSEIRNQIYELSCASHTNAPYPTTNSLNLLLTCRQIHHEAELMVYDRTHFVVKTQFSTPSSPPPPPAIDDSVTGPFTSSTLLTQAQILPIHKRHLIRSLTFLVENPTRRGVICFDRKPSKLPTAYRKTRSLAEVTALCITLNKWPHLFPALTSINVVFKPSKLYPRKIVPPQKGGPKLRRMMIAPPLEKNDFQTVMHQFEGELRRVWTGDEWRHWGVGERFEIRDGREYAYGGMGGGDWVRYEVVEKVLEIGGTEMGDEGKGGPEREVTLRYVDATKEVDESVKMRDCWTPMPGPDGQDWWRCAMPFR